MTLLESDEFESPQDFHLSLRKKQSILILLIRIQYFTNFRMDQYPQIFLHIPNPDYGPYWPPGTQSGTR